MSLDYGNSSHHPKRFYTRFSQRYFIVRCGRKELEQMEEDLMILV